MGTDLEPDDIILWPDGDCCFADELHEFGYKSDDYEVIKLGTQRYDDLIEEMGF